MLCQTTDTCWKSLKGWNLLQHKVYCTFNLGKGCHWISIWTNIFSLHKIHKHLLIRLRTLLGFHQIGYFSPINQSFIPFRLWEAIHFLCHFLYKICYPTKKLPLVIGIELSNLFRRLIRRSQQRIWQGFPYRLWLNPPMGWIM